MLSVWIFTACNNDIFVDDPTPSVTEMVIEGDGGESTVTFQPKGLKWIGFDVIGATIGTYYNSNGDQIPSDSPADQVARIKFENIQISLDIYINGNRLTVKCTEHMSVSDWNTYLRLDYGYTTIFIGLKVLAGMPGDIIAIEYDRDISITEEIPFQKIFHNKGPAMISLEIQPYLTTQANVIVEPEASWARYADVEIPLPTYVNGRWELGEKKKIQLATNNYYYPSSIDRMMKVPVDIPPYSEMKYHVTFSTIVMHGNMTFRSPTGREFNAPFKCTATEPISYEVFINENVQ